MSMFKMENTEGAPRIKTYAEADIRARSGTMYTLGTSVQLSNTP